MLSCDSIKKPLIIVADHDSASSEHIQRILTANQFADIRPVRRERQIYEILRAYHDAPEQIGLIIINAELPQCPVTEMIYNLSCHTEGWVIPFIVLHPDTASQFGIESGPALAYHCAQFPDAQSLMLITQFLLQLKQDRWLRHQQQTRLNEELAAKSIIEAKLKYLATHDELTGLCNRNAFERALRLAMQPVQANNQIGTLLFLDIDRFSLINELEGFEIGDRLLVELSLLIRSLVPGSSLFARIGADEFCLFLEHHDIQQAQTMAESIRGTVENFQFSSGELCFSASVSIGITSLTASSSARHPGEMILHGRQACNFAKINGRGKVMVYNENDMAVKERRRDIYWVPIIRAALRENHLFLVFQPVVHLDNGTVSHYEVLVRMRGEQGQTITPDEFIPVAERMGLIHAMDLWVVEHAIEFLAGLPAPLRDICLAINLSGSAFQYPDLLQTIRQQLDLSQVNPGQLTFEITETSAVDNFELTRDMIHKIQTLGCKFALDDFGAGFCSFNYLKHFPVDYVKIDGQFIRQLDQDETDQILVKSMVDIANKLGKKTIAEFVETPSIALKLKTLGVHLGQGYAFGKPQPDLLSQPSFCFCTS